MSHFLNDDESDLSNGGVDKPCYIHGIAYTSGMKYRVTETLDPKITDPENDPAYLWDPAVRLTHEQMSQDMTGLPMLFEHDHKKRVGTILHNFLDKQNHLNIIAEVNQGTPLGKWVARNVRAGLLGDLSIGYGTGVEAGTRKVRHEKKIDEVSFVVGGFFPGCEVKVRASKNQGYKNTLPQHDSSNQRIRIVRVMASAATTPPSTQGNEGAPEPTETGDPQLLLSVAELKKMFLTLKEENEDLKKKAEGWEEAEKKRREEYAKSNQPKYEEAMAVVEALAAEDGVPISDEYRDQLKYAALNPEAAHMFNETVRVTASLRKTKEEMSAMARQIAELHENNKQTKEMLMDSALLRPDAARDQRRSDKLSARNAGSQPLDRIMVPDESAPVPKSVPAWLSRVMGIRPDQASEFWSTNSPPTPASAPAPVPSFAQEQQQQAPTPVLVNASNARRAADPAPTFMSSANPSIKYPRMQGMAASQDHKDVWSFIESLSGDDRGFMTGAHLAGRDFSNHH